jgi:hypothetical protein
MTGVRQCQTPGFQERIPGRFFRVS